jgi:hypothetical protein
MEKTADEIQLLKNEIKAWLKEKPVRQGGQAVPPPAVA